MASITLNAPDREARDKALGRYMDAFSRAERMIQLAIQFLLEIDGFKARPIFATLMTKQAIDLLEAAAKMTLKQPDAERVRQICLKLGKRNMRRNHIVHGYWTIHITPNGQGQTEEWIRVYDHVNPSLAGDPKGPKLLGTYTFTIPELDKATDCVEETVSALSALAMEIPSLLAQLQTPEEILQRWAADRLTTIATIGPHPVQCRVTITIG